MSSFSSSSNPYNAGDPSGIPDPWETGEGVDAALQPVHLGSDPGKLLASLPSLLGFPPRESFITVGLSHIDPAAPHRMKIGPIIRADLDDPTAFDLADVFGDALVPGEGLGEKGALRLLPTECILAIISRDRRTAERLLRQCSGEITAGGVEVAMALYLPSIETGTEWEDVLSGDTGEVASVESNAIRDITTLNRARHMADRKEMEQWLDMHPTQRVVEGMYPWRDEPDVFSVLGVARGLREVEVGALTPEAMVGDGEFIAHLIRCAMSEEFHSFIVLASCGQPSAATRDVLAELVRRTTSLVRRRLMVVLALVLTVNDEGTLAHHTINRLFDELVAVPDTSPFGLDPLDPIDDASGEMAKATFHGHRGGYAKRVINAVVTHALEVVQHLKLDLELLDELEQECSEEHEIETASRALLAYAGGDAVAGARAFDEVDPTIRPLGAEGFNSWAEVSETLRDIVCDFDWERINCVLSAEGFSRSA